MTKQDDGSVNRVTARVTILAAAGWLAALCPASRPLHAFEEPIYKGRSASEWVAQLKSSKIAERSAAVREFGPEAIVCVPAIIESLRFESMEWHENSCNPERRRSLAFAIRRIGPKAAPPLKQALQDTSPSIRGWSAFLLAHTREEPRETVAELVKLLEDPDPDVRRLAMKGLTSIGKESWMATGPLIGLLKDDNVDVRAQAASSLRCRPGDLLLTLAPAIEDPSSKVRYEAVLFLRRFGPAAVPHLVKALRDPDPRIRRTAAYEIKELGAAAHDATGPVIEIISHDSDRDVRYAAATALGAIGPSARDAVPALIEALKSGDTFVGSPAVRALGRIGPEATAAIPALQELLKAEEARNLSIRRLFRTEIISALLAIDPNSVRAAQLEPHQVSDALGSKSEIK